MTVIEKPVRPVKKKLDLCLSLRLVWIAIPIKNNNFLSFELALGPFIEHLSGQNNLFHENRTIILNDETAQIFL